MFIEFTKKQKLDCIDYMIAKLRDHTNVPYLCGLIYDYVYYVLHDYYNSVLYKDRAKLFPELFNMIDEAVYYDSNKKSCFQWNNNPSATIKGKTLIKGGRERRIKLLMKLKHEVLYEL